MRAAAALLALAGCVVEAIPLPPADPNVLTHGAPKVLDDEADRAHESLNEGVRKDIDDKLALLTKAKACHFSRMPLAMP
jgi:hypothetical protein